MLTDFRDTQNFRNLRVEQQICICSKESVVILFVSLLIAQTLLGHVGREVLTVMTMKNAVFCDVAPCESSKNRPFGGTCRLHLHIPEDGILHTWNMFVDIINILFHFRQLASIIMKFL
jgi:hypothetical protein